MTFVRTANHKNMFLIINLQECCPFSTQTCSLYKLVAAALRTAVALTTFKQRSA